MNLNQIYAIIQDEYQKELNLYASCHDNYYNWILHTICVPLESLFFLIIICILFESTAVITSISTIIVIYYLILSKPHSLPAAISYILMCYISLSVRMYKNIGIIIAIFMEIIIWSCQVFIGHYFLNKNNPSMGQRMTINSIILSVMLSWDSSIFIGNTTKKND